MHAGRMATSTGKYVTFAGVVGTVATALLNRVACVRKGHDPVLANGEAFCRRCYGTLHG